MEVFQVMAMSESNPIPTNARARLQWESILAGRKNEEHYVVSQGQIDQMLSSL